MMAFNMEKIVELLEGKKKLNDIQKESFEDESN